MRGFDLTLNGKFHLAAVRVLQLTILVLGLTLCSPLYSQNLGRISGIVNDSSGGVIAGATITVTDVERSIARTLTTDGAGAYSAPNLIPSTYNIRAAFMGFKVAERQGVSVGVGQDVHVDLSLQPGEQTQTVTVTAEIPAITTTNAQLGGTVTGATLSDLPIAGHNFLQALSQDCLKIDLYSACIARPEQPRNRTNSS
jgi:carboxypeptidase family protein